ncbi:hypothetical protein O3M35_008816 [Rhynocoris fuscipes]|uniref:Paraneoplastic antigen Ma-like C-terminal domain-containing protein n=1 Tax=Rhynocoris fuscipes TaxID=488301 RepID=A0AAW1D8V4_9HEMI
MKVRVKSLVRDIEWSVFVCTLHWRRGLNKMGGRRKRSTEANSSTAGVEENKNVSPQNYIGHLREFSLKTDWSVYKIQLMQYFLCNNVVDEKCKKAILLNALTEDAFRLVTNLLIPASPCDVPLAEVFECLDRHFMSRKSKFSNRYKFYNSFKEDNEKVNDWLVRVTGLASHCDFGPELTVVLRDRFIMGLCNVQTT